MPPSMFMPETALLTGSLHVDFTARTDGAAARITDVSPPLELRGPFPAGGLSRYFLRNASCGVFAGDRYDVRIRTEPGARVLVQSSSATKVHAMPGGSAASEVHLAAEFGSTLVYVEGPTILQTDAAYSQRVSLVAGEGTLVYAEIVVFGRLARGENADFKHYANELAVRDRSGRERYVERFDLVPLVDASCMHSTAPVMAKVLILGVPVPDVSTLTLPAGNGAYAGIDSLPNGAGLVVRVIGDTLEPVASLVNQAIVAICAC